MKWIFKAIEYGAKTDIRGVMKTGSGLKEKLNLAKADFKKGWQEVKDEIGKPK